MAIYAQFICNILKLGFCFQRFYYDHEEGKCKEFNYGGCKGNLNRFVNRESCENRCKHKAMLVQANTRLELLIEKLFDK